MGYCSSAAGLAAQSNRTSKPKAILPSVGQTGTTSVMQALRDFGFRCYHIEEQNMWGQVLRWDMVSPERFASTASRCRIDALSLEPETDKLPVALQTSTEANVVLTWRPWESWMKSTS